MKYVFFIGSRKQLKAILKRNDINGSWTKKPCGGAWMRTDGDASLHWAKGTKRLWFCGEEGAKERLAKRVIAALEKSCGSTDSTLLIIHSATAAKQVFRAVVAPLVRERRAKRR